MKSTRKKEIKGEREREIDRDSIGRKRADLDSTILFVLYLTREPGEATKRYMMIHKME
jgi:hypothetical protein